METYNIDEIKENLSMDDFDIEFFYAKMEKSKVILLSFNFGKTFRIFTAENDVIIFNEMEEN